MYGPFLLKFTYLSFIYFSGKKRKNDDTKDLCLWGDGEKPPKVSKIWPVFDSGGYNSTLNVILKLESPQQKINPLLIESYNTTNLDELRIKPIQLDWIGGLQSALKQIKLTSKFANNEQTRKLFSSVSRQLRVINTHFQTRMFSYKYPRVSRSNVLLDSPSHRRPSSTYSISLRAMRFQPIVRRLPCYGNLELPLKIKQERETSPITYPTLRTGDHKIVEVNDVDMKVVKVEKSHRDREKEREKEKERESRFVFFF